MGHTKLTLIGFLSFLTCSSLGIPTPKDESEGKADGRDGKFLKSHGVFGLSDSQKLDITKDLPVVGDNQFSWRDNAGNYKFGYDAGDHWRSEERSADGEVKGSFGYKTPEGDIVMTKFTAGVNGYQAKTDIISADSVDTRTSGSSNLFRQSLFTIHDNQDTENQVYSQVNNNDQNNLNSEQLRQQATQSVDLPPPHVDIVSPDKLFSNDQTNKVLAPTFINQKTLKATKKQPENPVPDADISGSAIPYGALQYIHNPVVIEHDGIFDELRDAVIIEAEPSPALKFSSNYPRTEDNIFEVIWQPVSNVNGLPSVDTPNFEIVPANLVVRGPSFLSVPIRNVPVYATRPIREKLDLR